MSKKVIIRKGGYEQILPNIDEDITTILCH